VSTWQQTSETHLDKVLDILLDGQRRKQTKQDDRSRMRQHIRRRARAKRLPRLDGLYDALRWRSQQRDMYGLQLADRRMQECLHYPTEEDGCPWLFLDRNGEEQELGAAAVLGLDWISWIQSEQRAWRRHEEDLEAQARVIARRHAGYQEGLRTSLDQYTASEVRRGRSWPPHLDSDAFRLVLANCDAGDRLVTLEVDASRGKAQIAIDHKSIDGVLDAEPFAACVPQKGGYQPGGEVDAFLRELRRLSRQPDGRRLHGARVVLIRSDGFFQIRGQWIKTPASGQYGVVVMAKRPELRLYHGKHGELLEDAIRRYLRGEDPVEPYVPIQDQFSGALPRDVLDAATVWAAIMNEMRPRMGVTGEYRPSMAPPDYAFTEKWLSPEDRRLCKEWFARLVDEEHDTVHDLGPDDLYWAPGLSTDVHHGRFGADADGCTVELAD